MSNAKARPLVALGAVALLLVGCNTSSSLSPTNIASASPAEPAHQYSGDVESLAAAALTQMRPSMGEWSGMALGAPEASSDQWPVIYQACNGDQGFVGVPMQTNPSGTPFVDPMTGQEWARQYTVESFLTETSCGSPEEVIAKLLANDGAEFCDQAVAFLRHAFSGSTSVVKAGCTASPVEGQPTEATATLDVVLNGDAGALPERMFVHHLASPGLLATFVGSAPEATPELVAKTDEWLDQARDFLPAGVAPLKPSTSPARTPSTDSSG
jgi:hypothetical protein